MAKKSEKNTRRPLMYWPCVHVAVHNTVEKDTSNCYNL